MDITVRELQKDGLARAVGVVARGMRDNPVNVQAMRGDEAIRLHRLHAMFASALPMIADKGFVIGAFDTGRLVGVLCWVPPGKCRTTPGEKIWNDLAPVTSDRTCGSAADRAMAG